MTTMLRCYESSKYLVSLDKADLYEGKEEHPEY